MFSTIPRYRSIRLYHQDIGNLTRNGTTTTSITVVGTVDGEGLCEGTTYHEGGHTWEEVVVTASIKMQPTHYLARVKMEENRINFTGGVTCPYLAGYCFDTTLGESVWRSDTLVSCEDKLSLLLSWRS